MKTNYSEIYRKTKENLIWETPRINFKLEFEKLTEEFITTSRMRKNSKMFRKVESLGFEKIGEARFLKLNQKKIEKELIENKLHLKTRKSDIKERLIIEREINKNKLGYRREIENFVRELEKFNEKLILPYELREYLTLRQEITNEEFRKLISIYEEFRDSTRYEIKENIRKLFANHILEEGTEDSLGHMYSIADTEYSWGKLVEQMNRTGYLLLINLLAKDNLKDKIERKSKLKDILNHTPYMVDVPYTKEHLEIKYLEKEHLNYVYQNYKKFQELKTKITEQRAVFEKRYNLYNSMKSSKRQQGMEVNKAQIERLNNIENTLGKHFNRYTNNLNKIGEHKLFKGFKEVEEQLLTSREVSKRKLKQEIYEAILDLEVMDNAILEKYTNKMTQKLTKRKVEEILLDYYGEIQINRETLTILREVLLKENSATSSIIKYLDNMIHYKEIEEKALMLAALKHIGFKEVKLEKAREILSIVPFKTLHDNLYLFTEKDKYSVYYSIKPVNLNREIWYRLETQNKNIKLNKQEPLLYNEISTEVEEENFEWLVRESKFSKNYKEYHHKRRELMGYILSDIVLPDVNLEIKFLNTDVVLVKMPRVVENSFKNKEIKNIEKKGVRNER